MNYKLFPLTLTHDGRKVPVKEIAWQTECTNNQETIQYWSQIFAHKLKLWGVPTGPINNLLVLDVDVKDNGFETLKKYDLPPTMTQRTMSGGMHYIYSYPNDGNTYGNKVRFDDGLDVRGHGGYIAYYQFDNTPIAEAPEWLKQVALKQDKVEVDFDNLVVYDSGIAQAILDEACDNIRNAPEGEANDTMNIEAYRVGQLLPSGSLDRDLAFQALFQAGKDRGKADYEIKATLESGFKGGSLQPMQCPFGNIEPVIDIPIEEDVVEERWTPAFFSKYDLTNMKNLKRPVIFENWSNLDITITTADGGTGKTTLKLYEAICLALGENFLGFENKYGEGRTLFITGEDSRLKLGAMLGMMLKQMRILDDKEKCNKVLNNIIVKKENEMCLITKTKSGFVTINDDALNKISQAIEDLRPAMIVFDPIASFWGSESLLNDMSMNVAKFMGKLVEKSDACVEAINHMGKSSSNNKDMSQFAGRGGTGLPSHARVSRVLRPVFSEEFEELTGYELDDDKGAIMCNINKFSDGSDLYNKPFLIVRNGYLFERVTLVEQKQKEEVEKASDNERVLAFIKAEREAGRYPTKAITVAYFMAQFDKMSKDRVHRSLEFLCYYEYLGERLKLIENPDIEAGGKVYIITDSEGVEI